MNTSSNTNDHSPHEAHVEVEQIIDALAANHARIASIEADNQQLLARAALLADHIGAAKKAAAATSVQGTETTSAQASPRTVLTDGPAPDFQEMSRNDVHARIGAELRVTCRTVARWVDHAETLTKEYVATHRALQGGKISKAHTTVICDAGTIIDDATKRACFEEDVLRHAVVESVNRLREIAKRYAEHYTDFALDERAAEARKGRQVRLQPIDDDQAILTASLPLTEATGMVDRLTRMAWHVWRQNRKARELLKSHTDERGAAGTTYTPEQIAELELAASDTRTVTQLKSDLLIDLVLTGGPTGHARTPRSDSGTLQSSEITRPRQLDTHVELPSCSSDSDAWSDSNAGSDSDAGSIRHEGSSSHDGSGTDDWFNTCALTNITAQVQVIIPLFALLPQDRIAQLTQIPGFSAFMRLPGMQDPPRIVGAGPINRETARFLAGNSPGWDRILTHPVTGLVEQADRRQPSQSLKRALRARDQHCRFPGCRIPALRCEIDHTIDWAHGGGTTYMNLAHACPRHHRVKHHTDWTVTQHPGGVMKWVSPGGRTYTDRPPSSVRFVPSPTPPPFNQEPRPVDAAEDDSTNDQSRPDCPPDDIPPPF